MKSFSKMLAIVSAVVISLIAVGCMELPTINCGDPESECYQPASIEGTVFSSSGIPLVEAIVDNGAETFLTDIDGKFLILDVPPGESYTFIASKIGYTQDTKIVNPIKGEVYSVAFELKDNEIPLIDHSPVTEANFASDARIEATITDNEKVHKAMLFYKRSTDSNFTEASLNETSKDIYSAVIPSDVVATVGVNYYIYAEDSAGNSSASGSYDKPHLINVSPVSLTVFTPTDESRTNNAVQKVSGEVEVEATLTINGTVVTPDPSTGQFNHILTLIKGENIITLVATNKEGNSTTIKRKVTFLPSIVELVIYIPEDGLITNIALLTAEGEAELGATVRVNDVNVTPNPKTGNFSTVLLLTEGTNVITVEAEDSEGNKATITRNVILDTIPPAPPVMTAQDEYTQGASISVSWDKVTGASEYYVEYDNSDTFSSTEGNSGWIGGTSHTFNDLSDGQKYHYRVRARDLVTNESDWSNPASSTHDNTPPDTSVNALSAYQTTSTFNLAYTATDGTSGVKYVELYYKKDGGGWTKYGSIYTTSPISLDSSTTGDGVYEFYTVGIDNVGNVEGIPPSSDASTTVDTTAPTVASTSPAAGTTGVDIGTTITATLSEPMDVTSINTATFTLMDNNSIAVTGTVTYSGLTATFTPSEKLLGTTTYTATITTDAKDKAGNTAVNKVWSFTTETIVIEIAGGGGHTIALKSDGTVWTWGNNGDGQLGDGGTTGSSIPDQVNDLSGVSAIASGADHSMALKSDGTVWAWGRNQFGQLGDGTTIQRNTPVQVSGLTGVTAIAGGALHSIALKSDGTVWTWGLNENGQLGDGTGTNKTTPVQVSGLTDVTAIAGGVEHTIALKNDGTVWGWGHNQLGQLGDGTSGSGTNKSTPVQVNGLTGVISITL